MIVVYLNSWCVVSTVKREHMVPISLGIEYVVQNAFLGQWTSHFSSVSWKVRQWKILNFMIVKLIRALKSKGDESNQDIVHVPTSYSRKCWNDEKKNTNLDNAPNGLYKKLENLDQGSQPVLILAKKSTARYVSPGMAATQIKNGPVWLCPSEGTENPKSNRNALFLQK